MDETSSVLSSAAYDEVPYPSHPFAASHPDHLYSLARLFQFDAKVPDKSRILEIGCASGGNIIPMAAYMPNSECVAFDLSPVQIHEGKKTAEQLKLENLELLAMSATDFPETMGKFDYIICHGVFSWVPPNVQQAILAICERHLSENGVAYVSYNTLPGWYMRGMIRGMLLQHTDKLHDPKERIQQTRALLKFLVDSTGYQSTPYAMFLKQEVELLGNHSDEYIMHEHLEENNEPMFFHQFMTLARSHGMRFLGESNLASMWVGNLPADVARMLTDLTSEVVLQGQYMDFVTNRTFRQTLLYRQGQKLNRNITQHTVADAYFTAKFAIAEGTNLTDLAATNKVSFSSAGNRSFQTNDPAVKALAAVLNENFPSSLQLRTLTSLVLEKLMAGPTDVAAKYTFESLLEKLAVTLTQFVIGGDVEFRFLPDRFARDIPLFPRVPKLARVQAESNQPITNVRHSQVKIDGISSLLLPIIDGKKKKASLVRHVEQLLSSGKLSVTPNDPSRPPSPNDIARSTVDQVLTQLSKAALLEA